MAGDIREAREGLQYVGEDELVTFAFTTTPVGSDPTAVSVAAKLESDWSDVTETVFPVNEPAVVGDVITLSPLVTGAALRGKTIRIEIAFSAGGNSLEHFVRVRVRR